MKTAAWRQRMMVTRANYIVTGAFTLAVHRRPINTGPDSDYEGQDCFHTDATSGLARLAR